MEFNLDSTYNSTNAYIVQIQYMKGIVSEFCLVPSIIRHTFWQAKTAWQSFGKESSPQQEIWPWTVHKVKWSSWSTCLICLCYLSGPSFLTDLSCTACRFLLFSFKEKVSVACIYWRRYLLLSRVRPTLVFSSRSVLESRFLYLWERWIVPRTPWKSTTLYAL